MRSEGSYKWLRKQALVCNCVKVKLHYVFFLLIGAIKLLFNVIYALVLKEIVRFKR